MPSPAVELSEAETAAVLGVRRGTVKSRLSPPLADTGKDCGDGIAIAGIVAGVALVGVVGLSLVRRSARGL